MFPVTRSGRGPFQLGKQFDYARQRHVDMSGMHTPVKVVRRDTLGLHTDGLRTDCGRLTTGARPLVLHTAWRVCIISVGYDEISSTIRSMQGQLQ